MNVIKRSIIWFKVIYALLATFRGVKCKIFTPQETVAVIQTGKSLIRFGDGEFGVYRGKDIHYQQYSEELKRSFDLIKEDYEKNSENCQYLLAVPKKFMTVSGWKLMKKRVYVSSWAESRLQFKKTFRRDIPYGDSFLFEKKNKDIYSQLWKNENTPNNVIFVHNSYDCAQYFADTYQKNTVHVRCLPKNAFEQIEILEKQILAVIENNRWGDDEVTIAISAGPAGKVLVYRLTKLGYHCIDAGHCWDDPLEGIN